jgi:hypothetical protein
MKIATTILVMAVSVCALAGCGPISSTGSSSSSAHPAAGIGTPVRDGKFEFTVLSVDRSKSAGDPSDPSTAQGEYINVHLSVKNTGNEAQSYFGSNQKLIVAGKSSTPRTC